jgi:hypothetical protein
VENDKLIEETKATKKLSAENDELKRKHAEVERKHAEVQKKLEDEKSATTTIDGHIVLKHLIAMADRAMASGRGGKGEISKSELKMVIDDIMEDGEVDDDELSTARYLRDSSNYVFNKQAAQLLDEFLENPTSSPFKKQKRASYKTVKGVKYKKDLLDLADAALKSAGVISEQELRGIVEDIKKDGTVSKLEIKTLTYIMENYKLTEKAQREFPALVDQLGAEWGK